MQPSGIVEKILVVRVFEGLATLGFLGSDFDDVSADAEVKRTSVI